MPINVMNEFSRILTVEYARQRMNLREQNFNDNTSAYRGAELFPSVTVNELTFEYWKELHNIPVMARVQAFGAEAEIASREGAEKISGEIPTIKRKINLTGRALIALRREGVGDIDFVRNTLYNDMDNMIDSVLARIEKMRIDAVTTGKIKLAEGGVLMEVDFRVPSSHKQSLTGDSKWSAYSSATPIQDMQRWRDKVIDDTGISPLRTWASTKIISHLLHSAEVRQLVYGDNGGSRAIALPQLNSVLQTMGLPPISVYDSRVRTQKEDGAYEVARFWPEELLVMMPGEKLGDTLVGPTEEAMLDTQMDARDMAGVHAMVYQENEPPMIWTKASGTSMITFPMADSVFQAKVL